MKLVTAFSKGIKIASLMAFGSIFAISGTALAAGQSVIQERKENQQDRIGQGVKSGQLTPAETARLESKEARINRETRRMRRRNDGTLTARDKRIVTAQQNKVSKDIYRAKHNGRTE